MGAINGILMGVYAVVYDRYCDVYCCKNENCDIFLI